MNRSISILYANFWFVVDIYDAREVRPDHVGTIAEVRNQLPKYDGEISRDACVLVAYTTVGIHKPGHTLSTRLNLHFAIVLAD